MWHTLIDDQERNGNNNGDGHGSGNGNGNGFGYGSGYGSIENAGGGYGGIENDGGDGYGYNRRENTQPTPECLITYIASMQFVFNQRKEQS